MRKRPKSGSISGPSRARSTQASVRKPSELDPPQPGRPTRYSEELGDKICALIAAGVPMRLAARAHGIGRSTLYDWRQAGDAGLPPYAAFVAKLDLALARVETTLTVSLTSAARKDWRAAAWWLERRRPQRYGAKQTLRVEKPLNELSDSELDALIAKHGYVRSSTQPQAEAGTDGDTT
jgi:hypothetical protein